MLNEYLYLSMWWYYTFNNAYIAKQDTALPKTRCRNAHKPELGMHGWTQAEDSDGECHNLYWKTMQENGMVSTS